MKICVVGLGYIGLPTAALMAAAGHEVHGCDIDAHLCERLRRSENPLPNEPGLDALLERVRARGTLQVATSPVPAEVFILCVPTPLHAVEDRPDLSHLEAALRSITPLLRPGNLVVVESTVPPGTLRNRVLPHLYRRGYTDKEIDVVYAPERVLPGDLVAEFVGNDRIIGGVTPKAAQRAAELYRTCVDAEVHLTDDLTAEAVKLMENAYRDVQIGLANEFTIMAERLGFDIHEAIDLANRHPRVQYLEPGPGVGGHCLPIDPHFLIDRLPHSTQLIQAARTINDFMPRHVASRIDALMTGDMQTITLLGVAYKPDVDDSRNSPAFRLRALLTAQGHSVRMHDPHIPPYNERTASEAVAGADLVVLVTHHEEYGALNPREVAKGMRRRKLVDTRNALDHAAWEEAGFEVYVLGRWRPGEARAAGPGAGLREEAT